MSNQSEREITIILDGKRILLILILIIGFSALAYSYLLSLAGFIAPSQDLPLKIVAKETADQYGNPKTSFQRGQLVLVNATLEMAYGYYTYSGPDYYYYTPDYYYYTEPTKYLLIVQISYEETPVFIGFSYDSLEPDKSSSTGLGYKLPDDAPTGTYTVEIFVLSNWISKGGDVIAKNSGVSFTFQVTG